MEFLNFSLNKFILQIFVIYLFIFLSTTFTTNYENHCSKIYFYNFSTAILNLLKFQVKFIVGSVSETLNLKIESYYYIYLGILKTFKYYFVNFYFSR
jgi:hypothetical protein